MEENAKSIAAGCAARLRRNYRFFFLILPLINCILLPGSVTASLPVEKDLTGCVVDGRFFSISLDPQTNRPARAYSLRIEPSLDLTSYEGKQVSMSGSLLPGDRFIIRKDGNPLAVKGACGGADLAVIRKEFIMEYRIAAYKAAKNNNFGEGLKLVNRALEMDPALCGTYIDRAQLYYLKGDFAGGDADIRRVKERGCVDPQGLNFLVIQDIGVLLERAGKKSAALELYRMALDSCQSDLCRETMNRDIGKATAP